MHIDPILIEEPASDNEWLVKTKEPHLTDDNSWLDEARVDNQHRYFLDVTGLGYEISSTAVDN